MKLTNNITKIESKDWEVKASELIYIKGQKWEWVEFPSGAEFRMDEQNLKNSRNLLIFQIAKFWKFVKFRIWEILKIL